MKRKLLLFLLLALFLGIAGYAGCQIYQQLQEYREGADTYEALSQYIETVSTAPQVTVPTEAALPQAPEATEPTPEETVAWPKVDFEALKAINPDVVAWLCIEGTDINYPVVQGPDNDYYLYRLVNGKYNRSGSVFMDYRNQADLEDRHTVLYGHHMQNGAMFAPLVNYKKQSFYDDHPTGMLLTPEGNYQIAFFSGYVTDMNTQAWKLEFESDEEYGKWLSQAVKSSAFTASVVPTPQDSVLTLSTCTYEYNDARFVLSGILVEAGKPAP